MIRSSLGLLVASLALVASASLAPHASAASAAPDTTGIRATLDSLNTACARRDSVAFMRLFDDGDGILLVGSDVGEAFAGRAEVERFRRFLFRMPFTFAFDLAHVTLGAAGTTGWAFTDGNMVHLRPDGTSTKRPYRYSVTMVRRGRTWKWLSFHGSVPGGE